MTRFSLDKWFFSHESSAGNKFGIFVTIFALALVGGSSGIAAAYLDAPARVLAFTEDVSESLKTASSQLASVPVVGISLPNIEIPSPKPVLSFLQNKLAELNKVTTDIASNFIKVFPSFSSMEYAAVATSLETDPTESTTSTTTSATSTTIINNTYITNPIVERIITPKDSVSFGVLSTAIEALRKEMDTRIKQIPPAVFSGTALNTPVSFATFAASQKIDQLSGVSLTNITVSGVSGLTDSDIPDGITASSYLPLGGGTLTGTLNALAGVFTNLTATTLTATNATSTRLDVIEYIAVGGSSTTTIRGDGTASTIPYASTTAISVSGSAYIGSLDGPLQANSGAVSATSSIGVLYGGTGVTTAPSYGQLLLGNASSGYTLTATSSLGISGAAWGSLTGTLSDQTDLQSELDAKFSLTNWYATTTHANITTLASLASVGTITSGTWNGTTITVANGGTGATTLTGLLQGNGTSAVTAVTGTAGQYPYYNSSNTLAATSSIFLTTSGNVGIGTTSPSQKLTVEGGVRISGALYDNSNSAGTSGQVLQSTGSGFSWVATSTLGISGGGVGGGLVNVQTFTSSGTYTPHADAGSAVVYVTGGGGGGGGAEDSSSSTYSTVVAGGGAGGGTAVEYISSVSSQTVTVGGGGAGGTSGLTGSSGGNSTFGALATGGGGAGGAGYDATSGTGPFYAAGGNAGTASGGNILNASGHEGDDASSVTSTIHVAGSGGASHWGGGATHGGNVTSVSNKPGVAGSTSGSGGSGGGVNAYHGDEAAGGAGVAGIIIVYEYASSGGADLAELYPVNDQTIEAGEIVSFEPGLPITVARADRSADIQLPLAGIISTQPGLILGDTSDIINQRLVGLAGRVPTKVNLENGSINIGDRIALSSVPGVGRKARPFEDSVGIALESLGASGESSSHGSVVVFIDLQPGINIKKLGEALLELPSIGDAPDFMEGITTAISSQFSIPSDTSSSTATSTNETLLDSIWSQIVSLASSFVDGILTVAGIKADEIIATQKFCVGSACVTEGEFQALLSGQQVAMLVTGISGADSTPPTITILGNNPAQIEVGTTYNDLGATVTDNVDTNLGIQLKLGTTTVDQISIDTTLPETYTIIYSATDQAGNTGEATRTIIVSEQIIETGFTATSSPIQVAPATTTPEVKPPEDTATTTPEVIIDPVPPTPAATTTAVATSPVSTTTSATSTVQ